MMFLGEFPPLPPDLIEFLRTQTRDTRSRVVNYVWDNMAEGAVTVFEAWKRKD
jgi:hypothetical protein